MQISAQSVLVSRSVLYFLWLPWLRGGTSWKRWTIINSECTTAFPLCATVWKQPDYYFSWQPLEVALRGCIVPQRSILNIHVQNHIMKIWICDVQSRLPPSACIVSLPYRFKRGDSVNSASSQYRAEDKIDNRCLSGGGRSFVCRDWVASSRSTQTSQYAVWTCREVPVHLLAAALALEQDTELLSTSLYANASIQVLFVYLCIVCWINKVCILKVTFTLLVPVFKNRDAFIFFMVSFGLLTSQSHPNLATWHRRVSQPTSGDVCIFTCTVNKSPCFISRLWYYSYISIRRDLLDWTRNMSLACAWSGNVVICRAGGVAFVI